YNAKYSNSAFDHIALTDLSYELKDDGVNPVIGTMTGSVYNAPANISGTQEIIVTYLEDYGGELPADTASVIIKIGVKGYITNLNINPTSTELYTYSTETSEVWFDQFNNRYFMPTSPAVIWVDSFNRPTHEIYAVGTVEVYKNTFGPYVLSNIIKFDEYLYLNAPMTDGNIKSWGKGVSVGWLDNPEDIVYTIISGPGSISGRTFIPPSSTFGTTEIRVDYTFEGITVSNMFVVTVLKKPNSIITTPTGIQMYVEDNYSFTDSLEITVGFSDGTTEDLKLSSLSIIWRPNIGYFGTYYGNDSMDSPLDSGTVDDPAQDTLEIWYSDIVYEFYTPAGVIIADYDEGYAKWKNYEAYAIFEAFFMFPEIFPPDYAKKTYLNYNLVIRFNAMPMYMHIFKSPYPDTGSVTLGPEETIYDYATHFNPPTHIVRMITSSKLNMWDDNIMRTVLFFSDGETVPINLHTRSKWSMLNGGGSITGDGDPAHDGKVYLAPSAPEIGIHIKNYYEDPDIDGQISDSIEINVVKPMSITLSPPSATINTGEEINLPSISPLILYSDGVTDTAEQHMVVWSKVSGDGVISYPNFTTYDMTDSGSAILRCTYDYGGVVLPKNFPVTINVVPPKQVTGLSVVQRRYTRLRINWDDMPNTVSYNIYLDGTFHGAATDPPPASYLISGLDMSEYYTIEVSAVNAGGEGPKAVLWTYTKLLDAPSWLNISSTDWNSIRITWGKVDDADGYSIFINDVFHTSVVGSGTTSFIIRDLNPEETYSIRVAGYVDIPAKIGDKSVQKTTTLNSVPRPSWLNLSIIRAESLKATWNTVKDSVSNDTAHGYIVSIKETAGAWEYTSPQIAGTSFTFNNASLTPDFLYPDTNYTISVKAIWNGTYPTVADYQSIVRTSSTNTEYYKGSDGEFLFNLNSVKYEKAIISWQTLSEAQKYSIYIDSGSGMNFVTDIVAPTTSYTFTGLLPDTFYECEIRAVSVNNNIIGDTGGSFTTHYEDLNITANAITAGKLDVKWTSIPEAALYTVYFGIEGAANLIGDTTEVSLVREGLLPNQNYEIKVFAKSATPRQIGDSAVVMKTNPLLPPNINNPTSLSYRTFDIAWTDSNGLTGQSYKVIINGVEVQDDVILNYAETNTTGLGPGDDVTLEVGIFYLGAVRGSAQKVFQMKNFTDLIVNNPTNKTYTTFDIDWTDPNTLPIPIGDYAYKVYIDSVYKTDVLNPTNSWTEDGSHGLGPGDEVTVEVAIYYMGQVRKTSNKVFNMKNFTDLTLNNPTNKTYTTFDIDWTDPNTLPIPIGDYAYKVYIDSVYKADVLNPANSWSEDGSHGLGPGDEVTVEVAIYYMGQVRKTSNKVFNMKNFTDLTLNITNIDYTQFDLEWTDSNTPSGEDYYIYINNTQVHIESGTGAGPYNWSEDGSHGLGPGDAVTVEVGIFYMGQVRHLTKYPLNMKSLPVVVVNPSPIDISDITDSEFTISWNSLNSENIDGIKIEVNGNLVEDLPKNQNSVIITEKSPGFPLDSGGTYTITLYTYWGAYNSIISTEIVTLKPKVDKFSITKNYQGPFTYTWDVGWDAANGATDYYYYLKNDDKNRDEDGITSAISVTLHNSKFYQNDEYIFRLRPRNYHNGVPQWGDQVEVYWDNNGSITY
ncbi:MAG: fibronectin type III domain-containing protein, partial [Bacilli bacterium]|nr:fibronectin type III domain-containing protein [Bacilli bacterium]